MPTHALIVSLVGAVAVLVWRLRESRGPVSTRKIVIPPLGMSTGFFMFLSPEPRIPWAWAIGAFAIGALCFSYPLIATTTLTREGDVVMMKRSRAFLLILLVLLILRIVLRSYVERVVSPLQTGAIFFILAFGMLLPWRMTMLWKYRHLMQQPAR